MRQAELVALREDSSEALDIIENLIATAPGRSPGGVITYLWKLKAEVLESIGHYQDAQILLQEAVENAHRLEERYLLWRLQAALGKLYTISGKKHDAELHFASAQQQIDALAAGLPGETFKTDFQTAAQKLI